MVDHVLFLIAYKHVSSTEIWIFVYLKVESIVLSLFPSKTLCEPLARFTVFFNQKNIYDIILPQSTFPELKGLKAKLT